MGTSATRSMPDEFVTGAGIATRVALESFAGMETTAGSSERTYSIYSISNPGKPSIEPITLNTFHAGRVSRKGFTTPLHDCARPSQLTNVPAVSVNGLTG